MATMKDVAELAGVSTATVSHVVNGTKRLSPETTERVLLAIEQVKYNPNTAAKSLRSGQSNTVGVLVEDIRGLPVPQIVSGIEEILTRSGYRMLLYDLHSHSDFLHLHRIVAFRLHLQGLAQIRDHRLAFGICRVP